MKTLLISESKTDWELITRICRNLYSSKLEVICVDTKELALDKASSDGPFGFFMIDVGIKDFDPIDLTNALLDLTGDRPVLFVGTPVLINDRVPEPLLNANEFNEILTRPFDPPDLEEKVNGILNWAKREEFESSIEEIDPEEFIPMKLKSFYLYKSFPYDIYLEVTVGKYIRILTAEKPYSLTTLTMYAKKNVKYLYIKKDDQIKYLQEESRKCMALLSQMPGSHKDLHVVILKSITVTHQYMLALGVNDTIKELIEATTDAIINLLEVRNNFSDALKACPPVYEGVASKSFMTALIAGLICDKLGYSSLTTKKKVFVASILMDFTLKDEILTKVNLVDSNILTNFSDEDQKEYIMHPIKASEFAAQFNAYSDLDSLIANHHELPNRAGFPYKPSHTSLTSLNAIFNISQFIAGELDGAKVDASRVKKLTKLLTREFSVGTFKEVLTAMKKVIVLES